MTDRSSTYVISIVALVAVVGLVTLFLRGGEGQSAPLVLDEEGNIVGEAINIKYPPARPAACPTCNPLMVRLYESDPSDLSVANRIIFDEPPYSRGLNQIKVRQYLGGRVYLNIAAESGDRELILRLGENQDVNFGRFTVNVEFIGADNPGGRAFIVLALRRR